MRKVASIILNWNMERFLVPHIEMLKPNVDKIIFIQCTRPFEPYRIEHNYSITPDNSEKIVREKYPDIEVFVYEPEDSDPSMMFANAWNFGMSKLQDYDLVTKFDVDQFFTQEDLKTFLDYSRKYLYNNYGLEWIKQSVNYYYDFDHGVMDQVEIDPLIINPKFQFGTLLNYPYPIKIVDKPIIMHHFRQFKDWVTPDWLNFQTTSRYGINAADLVLNHTPNNEWLKCPEEIKELFRKNGNYFNL